MDSFQTADFIGLIQQYQRLINSVCAAWYRNEEDLKGLRQDIILQLWKSFPSFRGDSKPATWIYKVSLHTLLKRRRQESRRISSEPLTQENESKVAIPAFDDDMQHLRHLISRLADVDRATILLYLEGYAQKEIAGMLDMSSTNVSTRINRIKSRLKRFIMQKQFGYLIHKDLGYAPEGVVTVPLPWNQDHPDLDAFKNELSPYTFIREIGGQSSSFTGFSGIGIKVGGKEWPSTAQKRIDNHLLSLLNIPLVSGRNFFNSAGDSLNCIVNKAFVAKAGWSDPIGQTVEWGDKELRVIGVTEDFHHQSLKSKIEPLLMNQRPAENYGEVVLKIDPQRKEEAIQAIRNVWNKLIPMHPFSYSFLEDTLSRQYESEKRWKNIITIASALSVFISCLGLFGLAALAIENRTKEIGIRKVLGASVSSIMTLLSKGFVQLVLLAIFIAVPLAWFAMNKWLQDFAYRIELEWWMFTLAGLLAVAIALLTVSFQSIKAALMNPVKSLRSE